MKILQIRIHNLNSLAGSWHIDFTDPAYGENSLFAITGPTGAGKSTILDAVCLALYGRTPRLPRISKNSNEIMSRHTGSCSAEVEFSTIKGHFRCHWSQRRARKRPNGELQPAKHEIADASTNTILESKIKKVATKVEEVTGMDFDRFTRSTLLAQGGFAAFLEASADDRAPLLEQITGTEIYSRLSTKVHEIRTNEITKLADLQQTLSHIKLLTSDEKQDLQRFILEKEKQSTQLKEDTITKHLNLNWLLNLAQLHKELEEYTQQLAVLEKETKHLETELALLQPALEAEKIDPAYQIYQGLLHKQKETESELKRLEDTLREQHILQDIMQKDLQQADKNLAAAEESQQTGLQRIKEVVEVDHQKQSVSNQLKEQTNHLEELHKRQKEENNAVIILQKQQLLKTNNKEELTSFFHTHKEDENLSEELSALKIEINFLSTLHNQVTSHKQTRRGAEKEAEKQKERGTQLKEKITILRKHISRTEQDLNKIDTQIKDLLQGKDSKKLQHELFQIQNKEQTVRALLLTLQEYKEKQTELTAHHTQLLKNRLHQEENQTQLAKLTQTLFIEKKEIELLEKNLRLLERIKSLEKERKSLQNGSPCPLCGSKSHPYTSGKTPTLSEEETTLKKAITNRTSIENQITIIEKEYYQHKEQQSSLNTRIEETEKMQAAKVKNAEQLLSELEFPPFDKINILLIQNEQQKLNKQRNSLQQQLITFEQLNQKHLTTEKKLEEIFTAFQKQEKKELLAQHLSSSAWQQVKRLRNEEKELYVKITELSTVLFTKLTTYKIPSPTLTALPEIYGILEQREKEWKKNKEREIQLTVDLIDIKATIKHKLESINNLKNQIEKETGTTDLTKKELAALQKKRAKLFGNKDTEKETTVLIAAVKVAQDKQKQLQQAYIENDKKISSSFTLQNHLNLGKEKASKEIGKQKATLDQAIINSSFTDFDTFLAAKLDADKIASLKKLHDDLHERKTKILTLQKDKQISLAKEESKQLCLEEEKELKSQLKDNEKILERLQEELITAKETLKGDTRNKGKAEEQLTAIEKQKITTGQWNRLHTLIGSADGKKFRNFAQGLTFEMMVSHANVTLNKMSDRYILVRDKIQPLDLNVIDTFQAGEIRSTRNLSGGESFLVSLALALGFSRMASNTIRVDSLFLDEGFGTLDEDALESALDTLAWLHENNKLIGIISHVTALQERIPLQIEVTRGTGGRNRIKGPGVTQETE